MARSESRATLEKVVWDVRSGFDALTPGARAMLRRCATADDLRAEGVFWRLVDNAGVAEDERHTLAHVVACFDAQRSVAKKSREPFARWLRATLFYDVSDDDLPTRALRVRRLFASRDRDALIHELRRLLRHGFQQSQRNLDWGALGADIFYWSGRGSDRVRRRWAEGFFIRPDRNDQTEENGHAQDEA